ncbi:hypothetical protein [Actinomycetospora lemnae]|uniref:Uncharacterized protein n=1 Tax=Actinomycetospora lemnae TaxID=3019891 RepID=A0ABT5SXM2_9PSEU|nr:hypothetical protein [Actinomycetospora sp. DW7H6]MDD7966752.1 hypothetical protein [Actinomycetospora sp. DW7H6]
MRTTTTPEHPATGSSPSATSVPAGRDGAGLLRIGLHLLLAALPLLAISAHVFGLITMQMSAGILVIPLAAAVVALTVLAPHTGDRVVADGMIWGIVGCAIYDGFRLTTVHVFGWWADFIPVMGTWITGNPDDLTAGAVVGYLWRYIGDGGGIGITFFALACAFGLQRWSRRAVVGASIAFSVFPVWAGLMGTVAIAPRGQTMMFPLTWVTVTLSLIGHLIFGWIMGLGFYRSRSVRQSWPWEPLTGDLPALPGGTGETRGGARAVTTGRQPALPAQRAPHTPPAGQNLDPDTWELWRRQLEANTAARRSHRVKVR